MRDFCCCFDVNHAHCCCRKSFFPQHWFFLSGSAFIIQFNYFLCSRSLIWNIVREQQQQHGECSYTEKRVARKGMKSLPTHKASNVIRIHKKWKSEMRITRQSLCSLLMVVLHVPTTTQCESRVRAFRREKHLINIKNELQETLTLSQKLLLQYV